MSEYKVALEWMPDERNAYHRMARLSSTEDGLPEITCVTPPEFNKGIPNHWSPEHLLVASSVSCFFTTFLKISDNSNLGLSGFQLKGIGILDKNEEGESAIVQIDLFPEIIVEKQFEISKADRIVKRSEESCLITNSLRSRVIVHPVITVG